MKKTYKKILKCRLCKNQIKKEIELPNTAIGNDLKNSIHKSLNIQEYPLAVNRCVVCNHFQLGISVKPEILYKKNYTYLSGIGKDFIKHLKIYVDWIEKKLKLKKNDLIIDVGSNDGTCLSFFQKKKLRVCGVDPAKLPSKISNDRGVLCINSFFNEKVVLKIIKEHGRPKLITSHNVLAHIENIRTTFILIYKLLQPEGYLCFEIGYFVKVLKRNNFDTIYHEHLDYHTAKPLVKFLNSIGFSIEKLSVNSIQGGSLRVLARKHHIVKNKLNVKKFILNERRFLRNNYLINSFKKNLYNNINNIKRFINSNKIRDKVIIGYGAPTKAALFCKIFNLNSNIIKFTLEDNPLKTNKYIPSTDIKIIKYKKSILNKFDYIFLFAWNFKDIITEKIKKDVGRKRNLSIIIPNPKLHTKKIC